MRKVMKFEIYLLATLLGIFILLETFAFPIHAEGEWKDTIYRVYQSNDQLTQTEMDDLDNLARGFVKDWKLDLVLMVVNSDKDLPTGKSRFLKKFRLSILTNGFSTICSKAL